MRMFTMGRMLAALAIVAVAAGGCAQMQEAFETFKTAAGAVSGATVSPQAVTIAATAFDGVERTATNYLRLAKCNGINGPICRDPAATIQVERAVRSGRDARNALEKFMDDHPGQLGPQGLYDGLTSATATLKAVMAKYRTGGAS